MTSIEVRFEADVCCLVLSKGDEQYTLIYTAATIGKALATVGRWAANPGLSFSWYDAAVMGQAIRKVARG